jgi:integrase
VFENKARGTWVAQVYVRGEDGRRTRRAKGYATEAEARAALVDLRREHHVTPGAARTEIETPVGTSVFYDRTRGKWVGQFRYVEGGKRRAKTVVRSTETAAAAAIAEVVTATFEVRPVTPGPDALLRDWFRFYGEQLLPTEGLAADTVSGVQGYLTRDLVPSELAALRLDALTALDVYKYLAALSASGRGPSSVKQVRNALSKALKAAVLYGRLSSGVTEALRGQRLPRAERAAARRRRVKMLTPERARGLLAAAAEHGVEWETLVLVMLGTGLRRGEVLALRWDHIDFEAGTMRYENAIAGDGAGGEVYGPTKTGAVETDVLAPQVLDALRRQRTAQAEARLAYPWTWAEGDEHDDFVFTNAHGRRLKTDYVTKRVTAIAEAAGLGHITPHMLRHSAASFLAAAGTPLPVIQRVLHHASETITRDVYVHLLEAAYTGGVTALNEVLRELAVGE